MAGWVKALLFLLGGVSAATGTAYVTGMLDPWLAPRPAVVAPAPEAAAPEPAAPQQEPAADAEAAQEETQAEGPATTPKQGRLMAPVFDVLRVEPDGSVLVAGKAAAGAMVEVLSGETVLGTASAGEGGDFVVVLDDPLAPGDYRIALRATTPDAESVLSAGTAIVSIPETEDGHVLAMVEEPGMPAQIITAPQADADAAPQAGPAEGGEAAVEPAEAAEAPAAEPAGAEAEIVAEASPADEPQASPETGVDPAAPQPAPPAAIAALPAGDEPEAPAGQQPAAAHTVAVEAVEIEGDTIFVAGRAEPGRTVRVYADALLLGDAVTSEGGRFLVEAKRDLAVGDYLIRADLLDKDGTVLARAAVPFEREPGETIAAVAPPAPQAPAEPAGEEAAAAPQPQAEPAEAAEAAAADEKPGDEAGEAQAEAEIAAAAPAAPAAGEEAAIAAPLQRVDGAVIIRRGDSLWRISRRVYGHGVRYSTIYLANQDQISNPDRIWPGQVFTVPHETPEGEQADLKAVGDQVVMPEDREPADE